MFHYVLLLSRKYYVWFLDLISFVYIFLFGCSGEEALFWPWTCSFTQESLSLLSRMSLGLVDLNAAIIILHYPPF